MLSEKQIQFYSENGYVIVNNLFEYDFLKNYLISIKQVSGGDFPAILNPDREEYIIAQSLDFIQAANNLPDKLDRIEQLNQIAKLTKELITKNTIVKILSQLQRRNVSYLMSQMLFKEANTKYANQSWAPHQDNSYIDSDTHDHENGFNTQYITTNLFFDRADVANGTLYVFPGTHKLGKLDCNYQASYREPNGSNPGNSIDPKLYKGYSKVDCDFDMGALIIMNGNLIHGSYTNSSARSRPLLSVSYITEGCYFFKGKNARRQEFTLTSNFAT